MGDDPPTFNLTISDVTPGQMALILGGLGLHAQRGIAAQAPQVVEQAGKATKSLLVENPEAARYTLLDSEAAPHLQPTSFPDECLDELDLEVEGGEVLDARSRTDIEVE